MTDRSVADAIVIGSGASGSIAAWELTRAGLRTVVLEAGPRLDPASGFPAPDTNASPDSIATRLRGVLRGQAVQIGTAGYSDHLRHLYVNDRDNPYSTPRGRPFSWIRGRQVGGRLHAWGRVALRWSDLEFRAASLDGYGEDWPLRYADVEPYYDRVESLLGLEGNPDGLACLPDGRYRRGRVLSPSEQAFKTAVEQRWPDRCVISARTIEKHIDPIPLPLQRSAETSLLELKPDCIVSRITCDAQSGKATGVEYVERRGGRTRQVRGRLVFLCASAFESVRLLLNSACDRHPDGIGGSSGVLGRYLMDHLFYRTAGLLADPAIGESDRLDHPYDFGALQGFFMPGTQSPVSSRAQPGGRQADFIRSFGVFGSIGRFGPWWWMGILGEMLARRENRLRPWRPTWICWPSWTSAECRAGAGPGPGRASKIRPATGSAATAA